MTHFVMGCDRRALTTCPPIIAPQQPHWQKMHFFACAILCVEPSIHAWRRSFHLLRREISQPFAQDTCVTCHMHSLVNLLLGIGHHLSLKSQSVSFFFQFLNQIRLYYDAFFTRGILGHRPLTFFVTSHTTECTPATTRQCVHQPQDGIVHQPQLASVYTSHKMALCTPVTRRSVVPHVKYGRWPLSLSVPLSTPLKSPVRFLEPNSTLE